MRIVVTGSLAYDYIMSFPGYFRDHILDHKSHMLTVSFLVESLNRMRGGVAGNVAYSLALLGAPPAIVATAGKDFSEYRTWLNRHGIDTSGIVEVESEFTASCFINTDQGNNQIVAFYAGAMSHATRLSLAPSRLGREDLVVISPTDPNAMLHCMQQCRKLGVPYLFDPGKQTPRLAPSDILDGISQAAVFVGNDYELAMMAKATGKSEQQLIEMAPLTVITKGNDGSTIHRRTEPAIEIPVAPVSRIEDPTGAGDAYLAGLLFGLSRRAPLPIAGRLGALAAAYVIEVRGCQEHHYSRADFIARYRSAFGEAAEVERLLA